jgi:hypothetical protein
MAQPNDNWRMTLGGTYGDFTDGNDRREAHGEVRWKVHPAPHRLTVVYAGSWYGFDETSPDYFSPDDFWQQSVGLQWRHYLSEDELFWGSRRTYYDLGYAYGWDKNDEGSHIVEVMLHHDIDERRRVHLEARTSMGDVYDEQRLTLRFEWSF